MTDVEAVCAAIQMSQEVLKHFQANLRACSCEDCVPQAPQTASESDSPHSGDYAYVNESKALEAESGTSQDKQVDSQASDFARLLGDLLPVFLNMLESERAVLQRYFSQQSYQELLAGKNASSQLIHLAQPKLLSLENSPEKAQMASRLNQLQNILKYNIILYNII